MCQPGRTHLPQLPVISLACPKALMGASKTHQLSVLFIWHCPATGGGSLHDAPFELYLATGGGGQCLHSCLLLQGQPQQHGPYRRDVRNSVSKPTWRHRPQLLTHWKEPSGPRAASPRGWPASMPRHRGTAVSTQGRLARMLALAPCYRLPCNKSPFGSKITRPLGTQHQWAHANFSSALRPHG